MAPTPRREFLSGIADVSPILIGVFPFGVIAGVAAIGAGLDQVQAVLASSIIFAGASQLATVDLLARGAAPIVIVATALVINSRFAMYSASLSPHFRGLGAPRLALGAYLLTDQAFAVAVTRYAREDWNLASRFAYYLGAGLSLWTTWQVSSVIGVLVGTGVPPEWQLDFAIPLVFLALVFPAVKDRGTATAAIVAGVAAAMTTGLPLRIGLLVAATVGIAAGTAFDRGRS